MAIINVQLTFDNMNVSAQVGDVVYYTTYNGVSTGGFDAVGLSNTSLFGEIIAISGGQIIVETNSFASVSDLPDSNITFYSFAKNKLINTSSLLGYYSKVDFVNDSTDKAELFAVGTEVVESSK